MTGRWPARILTSQRLVRPSNFQNAPFAAVRNAWSTTRALLPSLGAIANRAACASLTDYQSFFCAPTSSNAQAGTFGRPSAAHAPAGVCSNSATARAMQNFLALGTHPQLVHLQNALFAIIAASYDLFKSMCAHSDYGHKLS